MRRVAIAFAGLVLVVAGCSKGVSGPQTYTVNLDAVSPAGHKFQTSAFFPGTLKVAAGDTIVFRNKSTEAPHTVSFGVSPDRSNQPAVLGPHGPTEVTTGPCYTPTAPKPSLMTCPDKKLPPTYNGSGFWTSGFLQPAVAPGPAASHRTTVTIAPGTSPGTYTFVCLIHPLMNGQIEVVSKGSDRLDPAAVAKEASGQTASARTSALALAAPPLEHAGKVSIASAGWGDRVVAVNQFAPSLISIHAGEAVTWRVNSMFEPHTVTFKNTFQNPEQPEALAPAGVKSGGDYTSGFTSSGAFGPKGGPFPSAPFTLRFPNAGTYSYSCILHPGMIGTVKVG